MDTELQAESGAYQPGMVVSDRYRITSILGQGGSGITYAAKDLQQNCAVALKALSLRRMQDWKQLELFEREAQVLAKLDHPQIPCYLDHFHSDTERDRSFYIVQALAPGQNLAQRVQNGWRTDEAGVRKIVRQVLEILTYLHQQQPPVVHRDLKPQNLVMDDDGKVYLVDFGAVQETYYNTFMRGSTMVGTFGYMAPEQFRGQAVPQTDLYALGATVLFLLTHRSPAELPQERLRVGFRSHVKVSDAFADWLERCLEPDLEDRMTSAKEALALLQGRFVMPNLQRVMPWRMVAGLGAASAVVWLGFDTFKYELINLIGLDKTEEFSGIFCRAVNTNKGEARKFLRFGNPQTKNIKMFRLLVQCNLYSDELVQTFLDSGISATILLPQIASQGSPKVIKLLLDKGANVKARDNSGMTPLHAAVRNRSPEPMKLILAQGADVNATDQLGWTPLMQAVMSRSVEAVKLLLAEGADVNAGGSSEFDRSPLDILLRQQSSSFTESYRRAEIVMLLLSHGAHVDESQAEYLVSWSRNEPSPEIRRLLQSPRKH